MPFRASLKKLIRRDAATPNLRERAAELRGSLTHAVAPKAEPAPEAGGILPRIAQHRVARDRWTDSVMPADRAWRKQHGLSTSTEAVAAAEAERDAADDAAPMHGARAVSRARANTGPLTSTPLARLCNGSATL